MDIDTEQIIVEAQNRWLHPAEICAILNNYKNFRIAPEPAHMPPDGALFLFDRRVLRYFRKDGHNWRKKKDGKTVREAHERLKAGSVDVLHCYYAHGEEDKNFQRRTYWLLKEELSHIALVHYRQVKETMANFTCAKENEESLPYAQQTDKIMPRTEMDTSLSSTLHSHSYQGPFQTTDTSMNSAQASQYEEAESAFNNQASSEFYSFLELQHPIKKITAQPADSYSPQPLINDQEKFPVMPGVNYISLTEGNKIKDNVGLAYESPKHLGLSSWEGILENNAGSQHVPFQPLFPETQYDNMGISSNFSQGTYDIIKSLHTSNPSTVRHGSLGLMEAPYIGRWHDLIRIELMNNKICELPQSLDCPKLEVLLLQGNVDLMDIPDSFFNHMPLLQHLDLSFTSIRSLPPSISKLIQLKKFYLRGCDLFMELSPQIGQLKNLEVLDLDGTLITHFPKEVRELISLQSLTLCFDGYHHVLSHGKKDKQISNSTIIPPGVISNLAHLNYLSINVDPEDERWNENVNSVLVEIFGLERLEKVSIYVPKVELLELIPAQKSFNFRLVVGHHLQRFISRVTPEVEQEFKRCDNSLKFINGVDVPNGVKMNLEHFKALYLDRHMTIKSLSDFELKNLHRLQICILAECNAMQTIVDASHSHDRRALAGLKSLLVFYMKNLRSICEGPIPSFLFLKSIALHTCPMITTIFTLESLNNFPFLEEIIVEDCPKVTTLMSHNSPEQKPVFFLPKLKMISLLYLPELVNICNGLHVGPVLEKMVFYYCPKLQSLSKSELSSKSLKIIKGESMWWEALKWNAAEWGDAGRPKRFEQIFSSINEEADMMNQLAAHGETQINTDQDEFLLQRKRKIFAALEGPRPAALRVGKESRTLIRKPVKATQPVNMYTSNSDFKNIVQSFTAQSSSIRTIFSEKETVQSRVDDITHMLEESSTFRKEDDTEEMMED